MLLFLMAQLPASSQWRTLPSPEFEFVAEDVGFWAGRVLKLLSQCWEVPLCFRPATKTRQVLAAGKYLVNNPGEVTWRSSGNPKVSSSLVKERFYYCFILQSPFSNPWFYQYSNSGLLKLSYSIWRIMWFSWHFATNSCVYTYDLNKGPMWNISEVQ